MTDRIHARTAYYQAISVLNRLQNLIAQWNDNHSVQTLVIIRLYRIPLCWRYFFRIILLPPLLVYFFSVEYIKINFK